ncbi:hypothetical protein [Actinoplanes octamycinicus]|uniref:hypothetical protein n=1 Tax=Actinoplanes octamycinicus TaxID=135948 RepID=UPI0031F0A646
MRSEHPDLRGGGHPGERQRQQHRHAQGPEPAAGEPDRRPVRPAQRPPGQGQCREGQQVGHVGADQRRGEQAPGRRGERGGVRESLDQAETGRGREDGGLPGPACRQARRDQRGEDRQQRRREDQTGDVAELAGQRAREGRLEQVVIDDQQGEGDHRGRVAEPGERDPRDMFTVEKITP